MKKILITISLLFSLAVKSQTDFSEFKYDPNSEKFIPYICQKLGIKKEEFSTWKKSNNLLFHKQLWYYSKSFYVKRNFYSEGEKLDESIIDISRFEYYRRDSTENTIVIPGFRDAIVLLPNNQLKYKP